MRILLLMILLVGAPGVAAETEPEGRATAAAANRPTGPLSPEEEKFQGTWRSGYTLIFDGRDFCADTQPDEWYEGYFVIRVDEEPPQIDFVIEDCACGFKGQASTGIFYWDEEAIIVLGPVPGKARPRDFDDTDGRVLMRLKRDGKSQYPATHCLKEY